MRIQENVQLLIEVLKEKEKYLCEFLKLTKEQEVYIKNDQIERLIENTDKKQIIIEKINEIDEILLKDRVMQIEAIAEDVKIHMEKIKKILEDIGNQDQENTKKLKYNLDELKEKMKEVKTKQQGNKIRSNYMRQYADVQGIFIDHK